MPETMTLQELHEKLGKLAPGEVILDVRTPEEFTEAHIPGAINISHDELMFHGEELKKYSRIYMHCRSGGRVQSVIPTLQQMGFTQIVCVTAGGMKDWLEAGYEVERG